MPEKDKVIKFLDGMKEVFDEEIKFVFYRGYCYWLAHILVTCFNGEIWFNPRIVHFAAKIDGKTLVFHAKAGSDRIFGSITSADIAEKIHSAFKIPVDKRKVLLQENLKELGQHKVQIQLHPGVKAEVIVDIRPEGGK